MCFYVQKAQKELEKEDSQVWEDNRAVYMEEKIYVPNIRIFENESYKKTMN